MDCLNVLVVDDSVITVRRIEATLTELGHKTIASASTGAAAVEAYGRHMPDLVTMDITMPDMDGIEATKRIIAQYPNAQIIMVTSHGQEGMVRSAIKAGAKGYVLKPVKADHLSAVISKIIKDIL